MLREGYGRWIGFRADVMSGLTVAIVALPLSMAIAIASGVTPGPRTLHRGDRRLHRLVAGRQPVSDRRARRRIHRAGGVDRRTPGRRRRDPRHRDGRRVAGCRRLSSARHLYQIHSLSGDGGIYRRYRRHHLRQPAQGSARHHAAARSRAQCSQAAALAGAAGTTNFPAVAVALPASPSSSCFESCGRAGPAS